MIQKRHDVPVCLDRNGRLRMHVQVAAGWRKNYLTYTVTSNWSIIYISQYLCVFLVNTFCDHSTVLMQFTPILKVIWSSTKKKSHPHQKHLFINTQHSLRAVMNERYIWRIEVCDLTTPTSRHLEKWEPRDLKIIWMQQTSQHHHDPEFQTTYQFTIEAFSILR